MQISDSLTATGQTTVPAETATAAVSSDFETFLRMLTVQLENQDPLNPVDSGDYAVQLATFSNVEQQVLTNDLLKSLGAQMQAAGLSDMAAWVGMEARVEGPVQFTGSPITVVLPQAVPGAEVADLVVRDKDGFEVAREQVSLSGGEAEWAGAGSGGGLPNGLYSFELQSFNGEELVNTDQAQAYGQVVEVRQSPTGIVAVLEGGSEVLASSVNALR